MKLLFSLIYFFIYVYALSQNAYNISLLDSWTDTTLLKGAENAIFSDVWGVTYKQKKYAIIGSTEGTHVFIIKNKKLIEIDFKPGKFSSSQVQHRDYKTYKNYLYAVCDEGNSSLQIFDLNYLPDSLHKVYDSSLNFQIAHNIFIDTNKAKLYVCSPNNQGMQIYSLANPINPSLIYNFNAVNYVHDCFVINDTAYLNCGFDGLLVYDFTNLPPTNIGLLDFYLQQGYNHSGWLSEDKKKYVFIDETKGKKVKICDASNIQNLNVSSIYGTKNYENSVAHNVQIYNDFAFISYYNEGLRIIDIQQINNPKEIGFYDSFYQTTNYKLNGVWGVYVFPKSEQILISDRQNGLFLLEFPIHLFRNFDSNSSSTPFLNKNSKIIYRSGNIKSLTFSIYTISGNLVYYKQSFKDWVNIPLNLSSGTYIYRVENSTNKTINTGKFVVVK